MTGPEFALPIAVDLIEQTENQKCVVFAGPGVAIPPVNRLGPPGPAMLAAELVLHLGVPLDDYSLPWIAQVYANKHSSELLRNHVAKRLDDSRYQPSPAQQLLARLPFPHIVYTGYDHLLLKSFRQQVAPVAHILNGEQLTFRESRALIQPYGTAAQPATLRLTEDERRQTLDEDASLFRFLRVLAETNSVLFLGYALGDRSLREFYHEIRPEIKRYMPPAYLVAPAAGESDCTYWQQHNVHVYEMEPLGFLQQLAAQVVQRGKISLPVDTAHEDLPVLSPEERTARETTILKLGDLLGLGSPVESGEQLRPVADGLALIRGAIEEHNPMNTVSNDDSPASSEPGRDRSIALLLMQQGNVAWGEGYYERAQESFQTATERDPALIDAFFSLFYLLVEMGEYDQALLVYQQVVSRAPDKALLPEQFDILGILGQTDVGVNWLVRDTSQGQLVRLTLLSSTLSRQPEIIEQFGAEVRAIASANISHFYAIDRYHGRIYLLTEHVEGATLRERLNRAGYIALPETLKIADQVAAALEDGQHQGVPSLGLQPENIVLNAEGAKLVDYGFHRLKSSKSAHGRTGVFHPSEYESPEQRVGAAGDDRSDVYALGTILYEMLAGRHPGLGTYQPVSETNPQAGEAIDLMIARARSFDPERRFRSTTAMRQELRRVAMTLDSPGQYLRRILSTLSRFYARLTTGKGIFALLILLALLGLVSGLASPPLLGGARLLLMLLMASATTATIGYYIVRETARQEGLGSLLTVGRGMGALIGLLLAAYVLRLTNLGSVTPLSTDFFDFLTYLLTLLMIVVLLAGAVFILMRPIGRVTERLWQHYTRGFYGTYLIVCLVVLLLTILGVPQGIITY